MKASKQLLIILGCCLVLLLPNLASAIPVVYSGYDVESGSLAVSPNATNAAAAFDAATSTSLIDFESALPSGVSVIGSSSSSSITSNSTCSGPLCGYNTTSGGSQFFLVYGGTATFTFDNPISAFGAYFTGWQLNGETITITYADNSQTVLNMPVGQFVGGTVFYGFFDEGASITSILYDALNDIVAVDDIRYGGGQTSSIPEPTSVLLLCAGLFGLAAASYKKILRK